MEITKEKWQELLAVQKVRARQLSGDINERISLLKNLKKLILENEEKLLAALYSDLGKSPLEAYASELAVVLNELDFLIKHTKKHLQARRVCSKPWQKSFVRREPYGSVLIISPWNYPFQLAILPLAGALAAGNACFIKPSEMSVATGRLIGELIPKYFSEDVVKVVEGDSNVAAALLDLAWDFIFFTGSEKVGSIIAKAAANHRIPSVLELGGKCPCIVDAKSVTDQTARKIIWGKFFNAGQTCIAPDYVLVEESAAPLLLTKLAQQIKVMYGEEPKLSKDYGRIIHDAHFARLTAMLGQGELVSGGSYDATMRYIEPSILIKPEPDSQLLQEEIFGPLLPVITYKNEKELVALISPRPDPLAIYAFIQDRALISSLQGKLRSGAFCVNQVLEHAAKTTLPFGGIGSSGYGRYHGLASLDLFTYQRVIIQRSVHFEFKLQYPPYQDKHLGLIKKFRSWLP